MDANKNDRGEYALWQGIWKDGKLVPTMIGYAPVSITNNRGAVIIPTKENPGIKVVTKYLPPLGILIGAARKAGFDLTFSSAFRTMGEQIDFRLRDVVDKTKVKIAGGVLIPADAASEDFILHEPNTDAHGNPTHAFNPVVGVPGTSNHQNGRAFDFDVTQHHPTYHWLIANAQSFGFIRTVPSEIWHWEYRLGEAKFSVVPANHPSWKI